MPRLPRIYIPGSLYYITCRGIHNLEIFKSREDYEMYFGLMKKYKEQYGAKVYAYSLMPSHLHLLLEVDDKTSISTIMHSLTSNYTKYFNSRYHRKGHLFRERYRAALIEKNAQNLLNLTAYIHLNAKKLSLALQAETYSYGSYGLYLDYDQYNDRGLAIKEQVEEVLSGLIGENYMDFVNKLEKGEQTQDFHKQLQKKGMLGSAEFIQKVKEAIQEQKEESEEKEAEEESTPKKNTVLTTAGMALLVVVLTASGIYLYFNLINKNKSAPAVQEKPVFPGVEEQLKDLARTEWQINLVTTDGKAAGSDIISFLNGKFSSALLNQQNFPQTNYSLVFEGKKMVWETMQTSASGTASWRGEVENGVMNGIMSLRQEGKPPQDFSFKSVKYGRKKQ